MSTPPVEVAFLDVGQGDTIVISIPSTEEAVVVDCIDAEAVLAYLQDRGIRHLRALVLTHLHVDHYRDAIRLLTLCEAELQIRCEHLYFTWEWQGLAKALQARMLTDDDGHADSAASAGRVQYQRMTAHRQLLAWVEEHPNKAEPLTRTTRNAPFPGGFADVLQLLQPWHAHLPKLAHGGSLNNVSGVLKVKGAGSTALLTADLEAEAWDFLVKECQHELKADVLKWPHHGAWKAGGDTAGAILDEVQPNYVVISVGTMGAKYDHPNDAVFAAIRDRAPKVRLLCTQATRKCGAVNASARANVLTRLDHHSASLGRPRIGSTLGCPCAGTIIVSLGVEACVLQPTVEYHRDEIIGTTYPDEHQCSLFSHYTSPSASSCDGATST